MQSENLYAGEPAPPCGAPVDAVVLRFDDGPDEPPQAASNTAVAIAAATAGS
jgi:hypothetical protein